MTWLAFTLGVVLGALAGWLGTCIWLLLIGVAPEATLKPVTTHVWG